MYLPGGRSMLARLDPRIDILPLVQREIWPQLAPAPDLAFVLYGGTAVALHLGHRVSIDFDFFKAALVEKSAIQTNFQFVSDARSIQEDENRLVIDVLMPSGRVKVSFFGASSLGRIMNPLRTREN